MGKDFKELAGVLSVLQTPFDVNDEIDELVLRKEIDWVIGNGADGVTTGMVSEILKLHPAERMKLHEIVCDSVDPAKSSTTLSCGAESTKQAMAYTKHAQSLGASAVMINAPVLSDLNDEQIYGYFSEIFHATEIPIVVQDASGYVGRQLSTSLQVKLFENFQSRIYFKPEAPPIGIRLSAFMAETGGQARVLEGSAGGALVDTFRRGVIGTMPGAEVSWAIVSLWKALVTSDQAKADAINGPLAILISLQHSLDAYLGVEKYLLLRQGIFTNQLMRQPFAYEFDTQTKDLIDRLFALLKQSI